MNSIVSDPHTLPAVLGPAGVELALASLKQSLALFRLALRSSAQTEGGSSDSDSDSGSIEPASRDQYCYVFKSCLRTPLLGLLPKATSSLHRASKRPYYCMQRAVHSVP